MGITCPKELHTFCLTCNGGTPMHDTWVGKSGQFEPNTVTEFLALTGEEDSSTTLEGAYLRAKEKGYLPKKQIPFTVDWGGN